MAKFCSNCGHPIDEGNKFCDNCGAVIGNASPPTQGIVPPPAPVNTQAPIRQGSAPEVTKTNSAGKMLIPIFSVIAVLAATAVLLFVKPGFLRTKDEPLIQDEGKKAPETAQYTSSSDNKMENETENETITTTVSETTTVPETTTAPETTTTTVQTTEAEVSVTDAALEETQKVYSEALELSTYDRPDFSEFEWCFGQDGLIYDAPENADMIEDPIGYTGGWKAMIIYNPSNSAGTFIRELDNIDISINGDSCVITIDWYFMAIDGSESYNEEDMEDTVFHGDVIDTWLYATGDAEISIDTLWREDGKQYALGAVITSDGLPAYLAMVRS